MKNVELLFLKNSVKNSVRARYSDGYFTFRQTSPNFDESSISKLIAFVEYLEKTFPNQKLPVKIDLNNSKIKDKLTFVFLECICYYMISKNQYKVLIRYHHNHAIHIDGMNSSPLLLLSNGKDENQQRFVQKFSFDIFNNHFRRVFSTEQLGGNDILCKTLDDISNFQKCFNVESEYREALSEVFVELLGNAGEHGKSDCLIDFDIAPHYYKNGSDKQYIGINIAIINFSQFLLSTALREKISTSNNLDNRYEQVIKAFSYHKSFFDKNYTEEDFFNVTAFQHKISGRLDNNTTGGTGLTKLIESLEKKSDANMCYVASGSRKLIFRQEYLSYDDDGWLGFNKSNNYLTDIPNRMLFQPNSFYLPGSAYNLNFVLKVEA